MFTGVVARASSPDNPGRAARSTSDAHARVPRSAPDRGGFTAVALNGHNPEIEEEDGKVPNKFLQLIEYIRSNIFLLTFLLYTSWLTVGCIFYTHYEKFTPSTAFYFAVEAGLAIGFCQPGDVDDWSKLFTIAFVRAGTTVVSGCVVTVIIRVLSPGVCILAKHITTEDRYARIAWPQSEHDGNNNRVRMWWESLEGICRYCRCSLKYLAVSVGYDQNRLLYTQLVVFFLWMGLGCAYGMLVEDWTFITSLYWAVTGSSGGGLQSAPCDPGTGGEGQPLCDMGHRGWLMGFFFIGGVPFYAMTMGNFAFLLARHAVAAHSQRMVRKPINREEFMFTANLLSARGHLSTSLNMGEFILLNFMRLGMITGDQIVQFREQFRELDPDGKGVLELAELEDLGIVIRDTKKLDHNGKPRMPRPSSVEQLLRTIFPASPPHFPAVDSGSKNSAASGAGIGVGVGRGNFTTLSPQIITSWSASDLANTIYLTPGVVSKETNEAKDDAPLDASQAIDDWDVGLELEAQLGDVQSP